MATNGYEDDSQGIFKDWLFTLPHECVNRHETKRELLESGAKIIKNEPSVFNKYETAIHLRPRTFTREEALSQGMDTKLVVAIEYVRESVMHRMALDIANFRIFDDDPGPLTQAPDESQLNEEDSMEIDNGHHAKSELDDKHYGSSLPQDGHQQVSSQEDQMQMQMQDVKQGHQQEAQQPHQQQVQQEQQGVEHEMQQEQDQHVHEQGQHQTQMTPVRESSMDRDESGVSSSVGRRGAPRGVKMKLWTRQEIQILCEYIQKQILDDDALSGMKVWKQAEEENLLPGRTAQSMRECYRRRNLDKVARAALISGIGTPGQAPTPALVNTQAIMSQTITEGAPNLGEIVDFLEEQTKRTTKEVFWAIYQTSGDFKRARALLQGKLPDFPAWAPDEDQLIQRLASGFRAAAAQNCNSDNDRLNAIVAACAEVSTQDRHDLERMLCERKLEDCAHRAFFLREMSE